MSYDKVQLYTLYLCICNLFWFCCCVIVLQTLSSAIIKEPFTWKESVMIMMLI